MRMIVITDEMFNSAKDRSDKMGVFNNSFTYGQGNLIGCLGEEIVLNYLCGSELIGDYQFDILYKGEKFEVKTKKTAVPPKLHYLCSVSMHNIKQHTDYYVFCRVNPDRNIGWICGYISKANFLSLARLLKKGDIEGDNGFIVKSDNLAVPISELLEM